MSQYDQDGRNGMISRRPCSGVQWNSSEKEQIYNKIMTNI
jgi:hypothetical protein